MSSTIRFVKNRIVIKRTSVCFAMDSILIISLSLFLGMDLMVYSVNLFQKRRMLGKIVVSIIFPCGFCSRDSYKQNIYVPFPLWSYLSTYEFLLPTQILTKFVCVYKNYIYILGFFPPENWDYLWLIGNERWPTGYFFVPTREFFTHMETLPLSVKGTRGH